MNFNKEGKKYGLEIRSKKPAKAPVKAKPAAIFGVDDDEEEEEAGGGVMGGRVGRDIARQADKKKFNKETEHALATALAEDPNAFSYDEVYDDLHASKQTAKIQEQVQRKSKYIQNLLDKTKQREREKEIVFERKLAKDRAREQEEFGDKEQFVTRAYREKLEERKKWLEEEKRRDAMEAANDVTKRSDLSDLYRNLFHARTKKLDEEHPAAAKASQQKEEQEGGKGRGGVAGEGSDRSRSRSRSPSRAKDAALQSGKGHPRDGSGDVRRKPDEAEAREPAEHRQQPSSSRSSEDRQERAGLDVRGRGEGSPAVPQVDAKRQAETGEQRDGADSAPTEAKPRVTEDVVLSARDRYLQRKKQRVQE